MKSNKYENKSRHLQLMMLIIGFIIVVVELFFFHWYIAALTAIAVIPFYFITFDKYYKISSSSIVHYEHDTPSLYYLFTEFDTVENLVDTRYKIKLLKGTIYIATLSVDNKEGFIDELNECYKDCHVKKME